MDDYNGIVYNGRNILDHECNLWCLVRVGPDKYCCRKPNYRFLTIDNTKHVFKKLPNYYLLECVKRLIKIVFALLICIHGNGYQEHIQYEPPLFNPKRHIPLNNTTDDINMSPIEGRNFYALCLMQKIQQLTDCGKVKNYVWKYVGKIDKNYYVVVNVDGKGDLVTKALFLHNTKVVTSKIKNDKARKKI